MDRHLTGNKPHFRPEKRSINSYRVIILLGLIMGGIWILMGINRGDVQPLFQPTLTPTRTANSFIMEGEAQFKAGALGGAITAYQQAGLDGFIHRGTDVLEVLSMLQKVL